MSSSRSARRLAIVSVLFLAACGKRVQVDPVRLEGLLDARADAALATPVVEKALDELVAAISADPRVGKAGNGIMTALGDEPRLQPSFAHMVAMFAQQPAMLQMVRKLMREHPRATPEQIGALMEKRIGSVFEGPKFDRAFGKAFDKFWKRPELSSLMSTFGTKVVRNPQMAQLLSTTLDSGAVEAKWRDRLVALNGGSVPDRQHATELLADQIFSTDRVSKWYAKMYTLPATKREVATGVARLLEAPAFRRLTGDMVVALVGDPEFQKRAVDGMAVLFGDTVSDEALEGAIGRILDAPIVSTALAKWMKGLMDDRELGAIGGDLLRSMVAAPEVRASFAELTDVK
jgi:hypothetical protein